MPVLKNCKLRFHTNDEDKDHDTHVTITVRDSGGTIAARADNDFGHFDDQSDFETFVPVRNQSSSAQMQAGQITIRIDPNGHDTWRFNFDLDLVFDDNSRLGGGQAGLSLDQNNREVTVGLQGILQAR